METQNRFSNCNRTVSQGQYGEYTFDVHVFMSGDVIVCVDDIPVFWWDYKHKASPNKITAMLTQHSKERGE